MKRMNILLSRKSILQSLAFLLLFTAFMSFYMYFLCAMFGDPLTLKEALLAGPSFALIMLLIGAYYAYYLPLYLEYDQEKVIAHYLFQQQATVWLNKTIYTGTLRLGRAGTLSVFSSEPFPTAPLPMQDSIIGMPQFASGVYRSSQILLPPTDMPEALALFPVQLQVPAEKADWSVLITHHKTHTPKRSLNRKLRLVPAYWQSMLCCLALVLFIGALVWLMIESKRSGDSTALLFVLITYTAIPTAIIAYHAWKVITDFRFCATVFLGEHTVETHFFGKKLCAVDLNNKVYYAVFRGREHGARGTPYIVVSNSWFNYYTVNIANRSYLSKYPTDTQVAFPYNAETAPICDFDNWHCVGGFGELNMVRSKDAK